MNVVEADAHDAARQNAHTQPAIPDQERDRDSERQRGEYRDGPRGSSCDSCPCRPRVPPARRGTQTRRTGRRPSEDSSDTWSHRKYRHPPLQSRSESAPPRELQQAVREGALLLGELRDRGGDLLDLGRVERDWARSKPGAELRAVDEHALVVLCSAFWEFSPEDDGRLNPAGLARSVCDLLVQAPRRSEGLSADVPRLYVAAIRRRWTIGTPSRISTTPAGFLVSSRKTPPGPITTWS